MNLRAIFHHTLIFTLLLLTACKPAPQSTSVATPSPSPTIATQSPSPSQDEEKPAEDFFTKEDRLSYNGYEIAKLKKMIEEQDTKMEATIINITKNRKTIASYDGPHHPIGNLADFGLFSCLGKAEKQLLVSMTVPRGGNQWIIDLSPTYREIFSTKQWGVGREGADLSFTDIDKDGVLEIEAGDFWYYVFNEISMSETPVVNVIFKYDARAKKYVPASHLFPEYALRWTQERSNSLPAQGGHGYLGHRVDVLLAYLYAGKEQEGWAFFDREYQAKDKAQIKARIRAVLKNSPVYNYVRKLSRQ